MPIGPNPSAWGKPGEREGQDPISHSVRTAKQPPPINRSRLWTLMWLRIFREQWKQKENQVSELKTYKGAVSCSSESWEDDRQLLERLAEGSCYLHAIQEWGLFSCVELRVAKCHSEIKESPWRSPYLTVKPISCCPYFSTTLASKLSRRLERGEGISSINQLSSNLTSLNRSPLVNKTWNSIQYF